jgi:Phosphodiester glycosidase
VKFEAKQVKKFWFIGGVLITLLILLVSIWRSSLPSISFSSAVSSATPSSVKTIEYKLRTFPQSIVHTLIIPVSEGYFITPALSQKLNTIEEFARDNQGNIAIFNAGFFDPANQKSTSYTYIQRKLVADPKQNDRLVNNPNLKPYLSKIFNRSEFRRYLCGQSPRYDIIQHNAPSPVGCQLIDAMGGGPQLLPVTTSEAEGFVDHTNGRDPLGSTRPNARTAMGIKADGSIILVMIAQKPDNPTNSGMSLSELADLMKTLGAEKAMNLDGGSSSSFYYNGKSFYGKVDEKGNPVKRSVKSVLVTRM